MRENTKRYLSPQNTGQHLYVLLSMKSWIKKKRMPTSNWSEVVCTKYKRHRQHFAFWGVIWSIFSAKIHHLPHTDQYFLGRGRKNKKKYFYFFNVLFILFCGALNNLKWSEAIEFSASAPQVIFWFLCSFWTIGSAKINHFLPKLTS